MDWVGPECGGWRQCRCRAEYGDHRCGEHTDYESPELVAFKRKLAYLTGMGEPNSLLISQMNLEEAEELLAEILSMTSVTRKDRVDKLRLITMIRAAVALMKFRAQSRRRVIMDDWIPPGARDAHRRSSGNSYEFVIRKHFLVLELQPEADRDEVLRAWKRLARQFHPDTGSGNEERMKEINAAKEKIFRIRRWD
jgi:DnaJ-domain-containing protein 1